MARRFAVLADYFAQAEYVGRGAVAARRSLQGGPTQAELIQLYQLDMWS
jgi:hypothetical protein